MIIKPEWHLLWPLKKQREQTKPKNRVLRSPLCFVMLQFSRIDEVNYKFHKWLDRVIVESFFYCFPSERDISSKKSLRLSSRLSLGVAACVEIVFAFY